ncbi:MAG: DUF4339 domain-containing protein [bacterium]
MLSTDNWCMKVASKVYGPYTFTQMEDFAREGRLSAQSLVSPAGSQNWRPARQYQNFASTFNKKAKPSNKSFGKNRTEAEGVLPDGAVANFILIFDVVSGSAGRLEHIIQNIGPAFRITENVWTVASDQTVMSIKNTIVPHLQIREQVFVIDASRGKCAWQNFVPEIHSKLTKAWTRKAA